ncbi:MAG: GDP-mannose 4,6-dehydratase [Alphaproteobacteria bacterium]|nr:GDP-mannose 4,6-dehydratase [Alphaproteobacteria bacterium]
MARTALITGITGQDGFSLARHLLSLGYQVHGVKRRTSSLDADRLRRLEAEAGRSGSNQLALHHGDMTDAPSLIRILQDVRPAEVYNLAAQSHVQVSFEKPVYTAQVNALGTLNLLEALRLTGMIGDVRFYQASTSEMFGIAETSPQSETTPFRPRSPYAASKVFAHHATVNYREAFGLHGSSGICFNHEGPERGEHFVSRKITRAVAAIIDGRQTSVALGNLDARRDWGHVQDYIEGMHAMLRQEDADDYVLATGKSYSVRDFATLAFAFADIELAFEGEGLSEVARDVRTGEVRISVDPAFFRPSEVDALIGDATKAHERLGWSARIGFEALVEEMVRSDIARLAKGS